MEFFRIIKANTSESEIQNWVTLENLEKFSTEIFNMESPSENRSIIGGLWGEFILYRYDIKGGVRFFLKECPNALSWTITTGYNPAPESIVVHLTINRTEKDREFIEEINEFLDDLCSNLEVSFSEKIITQN